MSPPARATLALDFTPGAHAPGESPAIGAVALAFQERRLLCDDNLPDLLPPWTQVAALEPLRRQFLGTLGGREVWSAELPEGAAAPEGLKFHGLRGLLMRSDDALGLLIGRAVQVVDWDRDHQFCGRCGVGTELQSGERARRCPACGLTSYPRLSPAVIVLVRRDREMLLGRHPLLPGRMYSTLAGFVEPGETLEETVAREIAEEVGVRVGEISYFGSQPWPFPNSLMIGFTAVWQGGEIQVDPQELEDAAWFSPEALPEIPPHISIARALIDHHLERYG